MLSLCSWYFPWPSVDGWMTSPGIFSSLLTRLWPDLIPQTGVKTLKFLSRIFTILKNLWTTQRLHGGLIMWLETSPNYYPSTNMLDSWHVFVVFCSN